MGRHCSVCAHDRRDEIDRALVDGTAAGEIASSTGLCRSAIDRHRDHIPQAVAQARDVAEIARAEGLLAFAVSLTEHAMRLLEGAEADGDRRTAIAAVREVRECLRLLNTLRPQPVPNMAMVAQVLASELEPTMLRRIRVALQERRHPPSAMRIGHRPGLRSGSPQPTRKGRLVRP